jgi:crotonobetainyl-CoA:carnitine CoA-transferase CaiB-like acyl-CoA transferase
MSGGELSGPEGGYPLDDLRVVEIGYGVAAPTTARVLADFGADVIKLESVRKPDSLRTMGAGWAPLDMPWELRRDMTIVLNFTSQGKRSLGLEIDGPEGRAAFEQVLARTDVMVMNMAPEAVQRLRLDYDVLNEISPGLIWINMSAFGSEPGPYRDFRTWGSNLSGLAGLTQLTGWPDRAPVGVPLSFPDYPSALWSVIAIMSALLRRDETGQGCQIDMSQFLVAISAIGPTVAQAVLSGEEPRATGNRRPGCAPHGYYPTRDADRYVSITVTDEPTWLALTSVEGLEGLGHDPRFATLASRLENQDPLDKAVGAWSSQRTGWEAASELQDAGVPASPVMDHWDVLADPQLAARNSFRVLPSTRFGADLTYGEGVVLRDTPGRYDRAAPAFGEHTREILRELAGLDDGGVDKLVASGIAHEMPHPELRLERPFLNWIGRMIRLPWPTATVDPAQVVFDQLRKEWVQTREDGR